MRYFTLLFLLLAIVAGILGFGVIVGTAATIAKVLSVLFIALFVVSIFIGKTKYVPEI